jgi:Skp family chaperone for outer membrane proteins
MVGMTFLQIFLLANAFILGAVVTLAIQYGLAHRSNKKTATRQVAQANPVPAAVRERIAKQAEANFQGIVNRSSLQLQRDLGSTGAQLNKLLEKFGSDVLDDEMRLFRTNVADIRAHTQESLAEAQDQIGTQQTAILKSLSQRQADLDARLSAKQAELEAELDQSLAAEKAALTQRLHDNLNDAVLAFLLETLGHEVDLGAQADYLIATLEANKADLLQSAGATGPKKVEVKS